MSAQRNQRCGVPLARARGGYFFNSIPTVRAIRLTEPA